MKNEYVTGTVGNITYSIEQSVVDRLNEKQIDAVEEMKTALIVFTTQIENEHDCQNKST